MSLKHFDYLLQNREYRTLFPAGAVKLTPGMYGLPKWFGF
jgi:hypothetical protein